MLTDEEITFSLPANKTILSFLQMRRPDQIKSIELGMKFINMGNNEIQAWNNEEWNLKQNEIIKEHEKEINKYKELLLNQQNSMLLIKKEHDEQRQNMKYEIQRTLSLQYEDTIQQFKTEIDVKNNKISELTDKVSKQFQEAYATFEIKLNEKEKQWENKLNNEKANKTNLISRASN